MHSLAHECKPEPSEHIHWGGLGQEGSISKIWGHRPSYYYLEGNEVNRSNSGGSPFITALQGDYTHKSADGILSAGAKLTYRSNDIYHRFYFMENGEWKYSQSFSNDLLHTELIPATYVMFVSEIGKKFSYKAGLRTEFSTVTLGSTHENLHERNNSNILFDFAPGKTTDIQLRYFLTTPQYHPQLTTSLTHHMNIGIRQNLLKGAMNVSLMLTDVFNMYRWEVHSCNKVFDLINFSTHKSRMLWLGITYNINSFRPGLFEIGLQRFDIFFECLQAVRGEPADGLRLFALEAFFYSYVSGIGKFVYLDAEVSGSGTCSLTQVDEVCLLKVYKYRYYCKAQF